MEKRPPLRYDFVFPNLSKTHDPELTRRLLRTNERLTDDELAVFFTKGKRPKAVTIEHVAVKHYASRFRKFGNRPFHFPTWQVGGAPTHYTIGPAHSMTFEAFVQAYLDLPWHHVGKR